MEYFMMGAIAMACLTVALFFLRFYRETGDRLFAIFALAFVTLGVTRFGLAAFGSTATIDEPQTGWYWLRLAAFLLILVAIADKNWNSRRRAGGGDSL